MGDDLDFEDVERLLEEDRAPRSRRDSGSPDPEGSNREGAVSGDSGSRGRRDSNEAPNGRGVSQSRSRSRSRSRSCEDRGGGRRDDRRGREDRGRRDDRDRDDRGRGDREAQRAEREREMEEKERLRKSYSEERARQREEKRKAEEERKLKEELEKKQREVDDAHRDDLTVLCLNLSLKADERDVYEYFSEHAGKVRDIQIIRDQRSGRSKGVSYIEFYTQESLLKALALSGQILKGNHIKVQASQAEKNRAAKAAKQVTEMQMVDAPLKLYVGGLVGGLATVTEDQLSKLFSPFGHIDFIDIQRDPYTDANKGFAYIQFSKGTEGREAMSAMSGFKLAGQELKVGVAADSALPGVLPFGILDPMASAQMQQAQFLAQQQAQQALMDSQDNEKLDDVGGGLISGSNSKLLLMRKLQRE